MRSKIEIAKMRNSIDFKKVAKGRRWLAPSLILLARKRNQQESVHTVARVGFTCSKKLGRAVVRNRAKRRLREVARAMVPQFGIPGWDYVLIGRTDATVSRPYQLLLADLEKALTKVHENIR